MEDIHASDAELFGCTQPDTNMGTQMDESINLVAEEENSDNGEIQKSKLCSGSSSSSTTSRSAPTQTTTTASSSLFLGMLGMPISSNNNNELLKESSSSTSCIRDTKVCSMTCGSDHLNTIGTSSSSSHGSANPTSCSSIMAPQKM